MELLTKAVRGTQDVLPGDSHKWQHIEQTAMAVARDYGFREMRTPVFEHTVLFQRSVGETTDVVQKEMYTFLDKGDRSLTLRPEGTAGAARALLEHGLQNGVMPVKAAYVTSCYRYENPQAGRLREFHQFGVECFGAPAPQADAEVICRGPRHPGRAGGHRGCAAYQFHRLPRLPENLSGGAARPIFRPGGGAVRHLPGTAGPQSHADSRLQIPGLLPARGAGAPVILDYLCGECAAHFEEVKACLTAAEIPFAIDPHIVRGLDYYTRTVFEFVSDALGAQAVVCGGGRYDGLCEELGGPPHPLPGLRHGP